MNKNNTSWKTMRKALGRYRLAPPVDKESFWKEFAARRELYPQHPPRSSGLATTPTGLLWGSAGLVAGCLALAGAFFMLQPTPAQAKFAIGSYEVDADHSGVVIWQDDSSQATILWIVDMEIEGEDEQP